MNQTNKNQLRLNVNIKSHYSNLGRRGNMACLKQTRLPATSCRFHTGFTVKAATGNPVLNTRYYGQTQGALPPTLQSPPTHIVHDVPVIFSENRIQVIEYRYRTLPRAVQARVIVK